ncbi:MAG: hypothetical protein D6682_08205 [Zetaproteobacteria bacterium]|nr:MAG: hypothetical protein D6682_08205 [Zetaproteobacteria bacterium]
MSAQPPLTLPLPALLDYDGWVNHSGVADGAAALALWAVEGGEVWLRSSVVAGKSHLVAALQQEVAEGGALLAVASGGDGARPPEELVAGWLQQLGDARRWLVDVAAGALPAAQQLALFHLIERARRDGRPLLIAWRCPEEGGTVPELASRLRAMRVVELAPPVADADLLRVLRAELDRMQWRLDEALLRYMIVHCRRDLEGLLAALHRLHRRSLAVGIRPSLRNVQRLLAEEAG